MRRVFCTFMSGRARHRHRLWTRRTIPIGNQTVARLRFIQQNKYYSLERLGFRCPRNFHQKSVTLVRIVFHSPYPLTQPIPHYYGLPVVFIISHPVFNYVYTRVVFRSRRFVLNYCTLVNNVYHENEVRNNYIVPHGPWNKKT
jgi:hypothetical protein